MADERGGWTEAGSEATMRLPDFVAAKEPAVLFSRLPTVVSTFFLALASWLDGRTAARIPALLAGTLFAKGRRTVTSWFRPAGVTTDFRNAYAAVNSVGRECGSLAYHALNSVRPVLDEKRLLVAIDDTPTKRYGPRVEGGVSPPPRCRPRRRAVPVRPRLRHRRRPLVARPRERRHRPRASSASP